MSYLIFRIHIIFMIKTFWELEVYIYYYLLRPEKDFCSKWNKKVAYLLNLYLFMGHFIQIVENYGSKEPWLWWLVRLVTQTGCNEFEQLLFVGHFINVCSERDGIIFRPLEIFLKTLSNLKGLHWNLKMLLTFLTDVLQRYFLSEASQSSCLLSMGTSSFIT